MSGIKLWALLVCTAAVLCAVLENLMPSGSMKKIYSLLFSALLLWMIADPLLSLLKKPAALLWPSFSDEGQKAIEEYAEEYTEKAVQSSVEELAAQELYERGLSVKKIEADTDIDEEGCIHINKITVFCAKEESEEIAEVLAKVLQLSAEVITDEE